MGAPGVNTTVGGRSLAIDRPGGFGPKMVEQARRDGVERFVCGFLPDELPAWQPGWDRTWEYFVEQWEFAPLRLDGEATTSARDAVVCVTESTMGDDGVETSGVMLAHALAGARGARFEIVEIGCGSIEKLAERLGAAAVVINEVSDWSIGFAIDEWAIRTGRIPIRWRNPGYSPLRYSFAGLTIVPRAETRIPKLREFVADVFQKGTGATARTEVRSWFEGTFRTESWRALFGSRAYQTFWNGGVPAIPNKTGGQTSWLDRPSGWAAFAAAHEVANVSPETLGRLQSMVVDWMTIEMTGRSQTKDVRDWAMARMARLRPDLLELFRKQAGDDRAARLPVARCVVRGVEWAEASTPVLPLIRAGRWALDEEAPWTQPFRLAAEKTGEAWWQALLVSPPGPGWVRPEWRPASVEACWARIETGNSVANGSVLEKPQLWRDYFGAAGSILHLLAALRAGKFVIAKQVWRNAVMGSGRPLPLGFVRFARTAFAAEKELLSCLRSLSRLDGKSDCAAVAGVVTTWARARNWALWQNSVDSAVGEELKVAIDSLEICKSAVSPEVLPLIPILSAHAGRVRQACSAIVEVDRRARPFVAMSCAAAFASHGNEKIAREIMNNVPDDSTEVPVRLFLRALVGQLTGDLATANDALARLRVRRRGFFLDRWVSDARWAWVAFLFRRAGRPEANELTELALRLHPDAACFLADVRRIDSPLAEGWETFLRP